MAFDKGMALSGLGGLLGGLFGDSGKPYDEAMEQYARYGNQAQGVQLPYLNAGVNGLNNYQNWLQTQQNPSDFINNLMGQYQQSPYNSFLQKQAALAGNNAASASGTLGSTPFLQQQQQNSANIGQQGLDSWLRNVLGINTQYGQGQQNLIQGGQNSANQLTNLFNQLGQHMAEQSYNKEASNQNNLWNTIGGGLGILGSFL
jgi:hypothetical protein